ncbi:NAD/FAD-utilizing enzyme [Granulosicoccus sp. 3-233]|uniref:NAD/FAD-utilizing enzyme n=1 Tax=Granulosicoccus sp. 3-233 TaxID=3417969 RepID=UPI003D32F212
MKRQRYYFISDDLDDLEQIEIELIAQGVSSPQIHVLSRDNASVQRHEKLTGVTSLMKRDLMHSALIGAVAGFALAILVLLIAGLAGWSSGAAGWTPFIFLAFAVFGAMTWLGGLRGIQTPNHHFQRFQSVLDEGRHVFFIDLEAEGKTVLDKICADHPRLEPAGLGTATPDWIQAFTSGTDKWWYWRMWKNV